MGIQDHRRSDDGSQWGTLEHGGRRMPSTLFSYSNKAVAMTPDQVVLVMRSEGRGSGRVQYSTQPDGLRMPTRESLVAGRVKDRARGGPPLTSVSQFRHGAKRRTEIKPFPAQKYPIPVPQYTPVFSMGYGGHEESIQ